MAWWELFGVTMQINEVRERIKVAAVFENGEVVPRWFFWGRNKYTVHAIEQFWKKKEGAIPLLFFAVSSGPNVYEIQLNQGNLEWTLERVYMDE